jgi:hypothetical protein
VALPPLLVGAIGGALPANAATGGQAAPGKVLGVPDAAIPALATVVVILAAAALVRARARARRRARAGRGAPAAAPLFLAGPTLQPRPPFQAAPAEEPRRTVEPVQAEEPGWTEEPGRRVEPGPTAQAEDRTDELPVPSNGKTAAQPGLNGRSRPQHEWWQREWQTVQRTGSAGTAITSPAEPAGATPGSEGRPGPGSLPAGVWESETPGRRRPYHRSETLLCGNCGHANPLTNSYCEQCWSGLAR